MRLCADPPCAQCAHALALATRSEFQRALGFKDSVYLERMFQLFDDNNDGFINFEEFLEGLSILSTASSVREKIEST